MSAIKGEDESRAKYLAMSTALAVFTVKYLGLNDGLDIEGKTVNRNYLRLCYEESLDVIFSGRANQKLEQYIVATNKYAG